MLSCQFARVVWREIKQHYDLRLEQNFLVSCRQWLFNFLEGGNELHAAVLAVTFCFVWEACNEARKSVIKPDLKRTCSKILAYVELINLHLLKAPSANRRESKVPSSGLCRRRGCFLLTWMQRSLKASARWAQVWWSEQCRQVCGSMSSSHARACLARTG
jgi:hypothetical protein